MLPSFLSSGAVLLQQDAGRSCHSRVRRRGLHVFPRKLCSARL